MAAELIRTTTPGVLDPQELQRLLELARKHLGTDVAMVTEFAGGEQVLRAISGEPGTSALGLAVGQSWPLDQTFCARVLGDVLPPVIPDARRHPVAQDLDVSPGRGIGCYVGAPLTGDSGEVIGMLCCIGGTANPQLDEHSGRFLQLIADLINERLVTPDAVRRRVAEQERADVQALLDAGPPPMAFQPIVQMSDGRVLAYEALARFADPVFPSPAHAMAAAGRVGLGVELELLAASSAVAALPMLPQDAGLTVNLSAEALMDHDVQELVFEHAERGRRIGHVLGVEITEHTQVPDYTELEAVRCRMQDEGVPLSVDDAGAGYASFRHILHLLPDVIKIDIGITRDIDSDPVKQALTRSLVTFADDIGADLLAEGVQTLAEHEALADLGVDIAQGYFHALPGPLEPEPVGPRPLSAA